MCSSSDSSSRKAVSISDTVETETAYRPPLVGQKAITAFLSIAFRQKDKAGLRQLARRIRNVIDAGLKQQDQCTKPSSWCHLRSHPTGSERGLLFGVRLFNDSRQLQADAYDVGEGGVTRLLEERSFVAPKAARAADGRWYCAFVAGCLAEFQQQLPPEHRRRKNVAIGVSSAVPLTSRPATQALDARQTAFARPDVGAFGGVFDLHRSDFVDQFRVACKAADLPLGAACVATDAASALLHAAFATGQRRRPSSPACRLSLVANLADASVCCVVTDAEFLHRCLPGRQLPSLPGVGRCVLADTRAAEAEVPRGILSVVEASINDRIGRGVSWQTLASGQWLGHLLRVTARVAQLVQGLSADDFEVMTDSRCWQVFIACSQWTATRCRNRRKNLVQLLQPHLPMRPLLLRDALVLRQICAAILGRVASVQAAALVGAASCIFPQQLPPRLPIAVAGEFFAALHGFSQMLRRAVLLLLPKGVRVELYHTRCNFGAAVAAATLLPEQKKQQPPGKQRTKNSEVSSD